MDKISCEIAVFMPAYNAGLYIKEALESVLKQTESNFVIIASDDCSTDNTADIIKNYSEIDERIIFLENKVNLGPNANFNRILDYICTTIDCRYIAFFAGDDVMFPQRLATQKQIMDESLEADICFCDVEVLNESGAKQLNSKIIKSPKQLYPYDYLIKEFAFLTTGAFIRTKAVNGHRYKECFASDFIFFINIAMKQKKYIVYINSPLTIYRRHSNGLTSQTLKKWQLLLRWGQYHHLLFKNYPAYSYWLTKNYLLKLYKGGLKSLKDYF